MKLKKKDLYVSYSSSTAIKINHEKEKKAFFKYFCTLEKYDSII